MGGQERNGVNYVTGMAILKGDMYLISCGLNLNPLLWLQKLNGVAVVRLVKEAGSECCIGPFPCSPHFTLLHV